MRKKEKGKEAVVGVLENDFKRGGSPRFVLRWNNPLKQVEEEKESLWIRLWRTVKHKWKWLLRDLLVTSFNDEGEGERSRRSGAKSSICIEFFFSFFH